MNIPGVIDSEREVHAAIYINEFELFNKMTTYSTSTYEVVNAEEVDKNYLYTYPIHRFNVTNKQGNRQTLMCQSEKCKNEVIYKDCQSLSQIEADIDSPDFINIYQKTLEIEAEVASFLFEDHLPSHEKVQFLMTELDRLQNEIVELSFHSPTQEWQIKYFKALVISLQNQLTTKQPNWLAK